MEKDSAQEEILVRVGEIFLKSKPVMERFSLILDNNIMNALKKEGLEFSIYKKRFRIFIRAEEIGKAKKIVANVPGIHSFSQCMHIESNELAGIKNFVAENYAKWIAENESFAVRAKVDSEQKYGGKDVEIEVGNVVKRKVNLSRPDRTIFIEVSKNDSYVFTENEKGIGGLPVGSSGKVMSMLSGGIDSPVSSFLVMKRGCSVELIHFHSFPLVSSKSIEKAKALARALGKFQMKIRMHLVPFADYQMKVKAGSEQRNRVLLYRRGMLKIAEKIAEKNKIGCLVTGEAIAQVSSQTLDNIAITNEAVKMPVLRPLLGMDKEEIIAISKKIGTYEISIQPHEDCCTLFVPDHASAKGNLAEIKEIEKGLKLNPLMNKIIKKEEIVEIK